MNEKCVQVIPCLSNILCPYKADLVAFETIIKTDVENSKKPLIVFARAGKKIILNFHNVCNLTLMSTFSLNRGTCYRSIRRSCKF